MKSNELRIGNWVDNDIHGVGLVESLSGLNILYSRNYDSLPTSKITPIPLTEDWLIRFGFKADFNGEYEILPFLYIWKPSSSTKSFSVSPNSNFPSTLKIQYVHQLQNLFFALTSEELELKQ